jgi:hypothetical protein
MSIFAFLNSLENQAWKAEYMIPYNAHDQGNMRGQILVFNGLSDRIE